MINPWKDNDEIINILQWTVKSYMCAAEWRIIWRKVIAVVFNATYVCSCEKKAWKKIQAVDVDHAQEVDWNGERIYRHSFLLCFLKKIPSNRHDAYLPLWLKKKSSLQAMELLIKTSATYMSSTFWSRKLAFLKVNIYISLEIFQWPFCHVAFVAFILYQSALLLNFAMC